jgi:hypothetical protein
MSAKNGSPANVMPVSCSGLITRPVQPLPSRLCQHQPYSFASRPFSIAGRFEDRLRSGRRPPHSLRSLFSLDEKKTGEVQGKCV